MQGTRTAFSLFALLLLFTLPDVAWTQDASARARRVLLIGQGPDGHPVTTHEYRAAVKLLATLLSRAERVQTIVVSADGDWADGPELLDGADAAVLFVSQGAKWIQTDAKRLAAFQSLTKRGGGLVCLHWGMGTKDAEDIPAFVNLFGACHGGPDRKYKVVDLKTEPGQRDHPVLRGVTPIETHEEFYYRLKMASPKEQIVPLIRVTIDGESHPVAWAWERPDGGRSAGYSAMHFHDNWKHEANRRLVVQSILWTLKRDIPDDGVNVSVEPSDLALPAIESVEKAK